MFLQAPACRISPLQPIFSSTGRKRFIPMAETAMEYLVPRDYEGGYSVKNKWRIALRMAVQAIVKTFGEPDPGFDKFKHEEDMSTEGRSR